MESGPPFLPDWHDAAAYAPLLAADRAILAWEWLRRVPAYRTAAAVEASGERGAARWGLHRFEDPHRAAPVARPMWRAEALSTVLAAAAIPVQSGAADLAALSCSVIRYASEGAERVLLCDGWRLIRLDVVEGLLGDGPARLRFLIDGPPALTASIMTLRRFDALMRRGDFSRALHPPAPRADRLVRVLRTADGLAIGARQRDIAAVLLGADVGRPGWREDHPALRLQAQRLMRDARASLAGGFRALLRPSPECAWPFRLAEDWPGSKSPGLDREPPANAE